jgi:hypothetical protein
MPTGKRASGLPSLAGWAAALSWLTGIDVAGGGGIVRESLAITAAFLFLVIFGAAVLGLAIHIVLWAAGAGW